MDMSRNLGPNVDPDDMPHPYEYDDRVPLSPSLDSGNPDPWADLDPRTKNRGEDPVVTCAESGCDATHRDRHQWDQGEAAKKGWFFQKDGKRWCPEHNPPWVAEWRARKAAEKAAQDPP